MIKLALALVAATALTSAAEAATTYNFVVSPLAGTVGRTFTFQLTGAPTNTGLAFPSFRQVGFSYTNPGSTTPVVLAPGVNGRNINFFNTQNNGGVGITFGGGEAFFAYGPSLFNETLYVAGNGGTIAPNAPVFNIGTYQLRSPNTNSPFNYQIAISDAAASAVPEASTWAMMIGGFGLLGAGLRRRTVRVRFA